MSSLPLAQGRHLDGKNIQPVKHILPERACRHCSLQVAVGGRDDADVHGNRLTASHALKFPLLQHPQKSDLRLHGEFADLVQKDRPAIGGFKAAQSPLQRPGECAFFVSKQFGSDQRRRNRRTVDADKRARRSDSTAHEWRAQSILSPFRFRPR